jgi:putative ABC transport system ATP-binding protein
VAVPVVEASGLIKDYRRGAQVVRALDGVSLAVERSEFICVMGPSGSGKSTLLHVLGALDEPTAGQVRIDGTDLAALSDDERAEFRRTRLGFVFQFFNLLPTLSAWENVAVPWLLGGERLPVRRPDAVELLERVGLADRADHRPAELSGGQLQRVAIARALACDPVLVLADEPTGNLDRRTGSGVLDVLRSCGATTVMVTHDAQLAARADRTVELVDGRIVDVGG